MIVFFYYYHVFCALLKRPFRHHFLGGGVLEGKSTYFVGASLVQKLSQAILQYGELDALDILVAHLGGKDHKKKAFFGGFKGFLAAFGDFW